MIFKNSFRILFAMLSLIFCLGAEASGLSPIAKLNRISQTVRGHGVTLAERKDLEFAIANNSIDAFLTQKIDEYLASPEHVHKMELRLEDLFRLKIFSSIENTLDENFVLQPGDPTLSKYNKENALNYLFREIAEKNLSWDQLLNRKSYRFFNRARSQFQSDFGMQDYGFISALVPDLKSITGVYSDNISTDKFKDIQFDANDLRIAGSITTSRFLSRYVTTGLNKNRRRAAAIFRIFLCDSMSASIPSSAGQDDAIFDLMYPHDNSMTENELRQMMQQSDSIHGSKADCKACHFKLDPMGKTLLMSSMALSPKANSGALSFKRENQIINIPVRGIGELGQAITQQPEYLRCQTQHFWNWIIGENKLLSSDRLDTLSSEFDRVGRRPNDFIKILMNQPEFYEVNIPLTENALRAKQVKTILQKCQNCHKDQTNSNAPYYFPDFTKWPIGGSSQEMQSWVQKISHELDLAHEGENPTMPPKSAPWRLTIKEIDVLKNWVDLGAPDENGVKGF